MKGKFLKSIFVFTAVIAGALIMQLSVFAAPYNGNECELRQPDGTMITVKLYGDEFYGRMESTDGYTIVKDPKTGWFCYADLNSDASDFISTGIPYGSSNVSNINAATQSSKAKLKKGVTIDQKHFIKKVEEGRKLLKADEAPENNLPKSKVSPKSGTSLAPSAPVSLTPGTSSATYSSGTSSTAYVNTPIVPLSGEVKGLTVLIKFPDDAANNIPILPQKEIDNMFNQEGYNNNGNNGSVRDYFYDVSGGSLTYTNIVTPIYYTAKHDRAYYDDPTIYYPYRAQELIEEALQSLADQNFDFSALTKNQNGYVKCLNVMYSGTRQSDWSEGLWPHKSSLGTFTCNGTKFGTYQITDIGTTPVIGTIIHETGHAMCYWPDTYVYQDPITKTTKGKGTGNYDLMSNSGDRNPLLPDPYCTYRISGWGSATRLNDYTEKSSFTANSNSHNLFIYETSNPNEYFIIENMQKTGRRQNLPDEGLAIWHIDESGDNTDPSGTHYKVSLEQADGLNHLENAINSGHDGDLFHSGDKNTFGTNTTPSSSLRDGSSSGLTISNISSISNCMSFEYEPLNTTLENAPSHLSISNRSGNTIELSWFSPTVFVADHYNVTAEVNNGSTITTVNMGTTTSNSISLNLSSNNIYTFHVVGVNAAGNQSDPSNAYVFSTDYIAPTAPTGLRTTGASSIAAGLSWYEASDNLGVIRYEIYNGSTLLETSTTSSCTIKNLTPNTTYNLTVYAYDTNNMSAASNTLILTTRMAAPINVKAINKTSSSVTLGWSALSGASLYNVYAYVYNGINYTRYDFSNTSNTSMVINTTSNYIYNFYVQAVNASGDFMSDPSTEFIYSTDAIAPSAPTNLSYSNLTSDSVNLSWTASTDNLGVLSYNVYDGTNLIGESCGTAFKVSNFNAGVSHTFTVKAVDKNGNVSAASNAVNIISNTLEVKSFNQLTAATLNQISEAVSLKNTGSSTINFSDIKIRYYYTSDAATNPVDQAFSCDYFTNGNSNVTGNFVNMSTPKTNANYYVEVGFTSTAGSIAPGETKEVKFRINKADWSNYTQTNDYSFNSSSNNSYLVWNKITVYNSDTLVYGVEP